MSWQKIEEIFSEALEVPTGERPAFLNRRCAGDAKLRAEVAAMLAADESTGDPIAASVAAAPISLAKFFARPETVEPRSLSITGEFFGDYRIERKLGAGGMGAVYLAEKTSGEKVAVKFIKSGMDTKFNQRRFRHEQKILAAFDHPNITRLIDAGVTETGMPFLVMEYVEGETIFNYARRRQLDLKEKLELFRPLFRAVAYAHERGVLHRDIKPGNIMIAEGGTPKLLDFGIAKILNPELLEEPPSHTATHFRPFTPDYAAPEQVRGEQMSEASDVYSLGVLLYELLCGERPYRTDKTSPYEIVRIVCEEIPRPPSEAINSRRTTLRNFQDSFSPEKHFLAELDKVLLKALQKKPALRYASVEDFDADVERLIAGRNVRAETLDHLPSLENYGATKPREQTAANSLAILPFEVLTEDRENDAQKDASGFLGIGLADVLTTRLGSYSQIIVRPTSSVLRLCAQGLDIDALGEQLKVEYLLEGHVLRIENSYRVNVKLLSVADHRVLWSDKFDATELNLFHLQDLIAEKVVRSLVPKITGGEAGRNRRSEIVSDEAFEAYLRGRFYWHSYTFEGILKAEEYFKKAIELAPDYALAYTGLADYYNRLGVSGTTLPKRSFGLAKKYALRALKIDANLPEAYASLAFSVWAYEWDSEAAENLYRRAIELNPNNAWAYEWYAYLLSSENRHDEAIPMIECAERLDPNSPTLAAMSGFLLFNARRYEEAYAKTLRSLELMPNYYLALQGLGWVCPPIGRYEEAIEGARRAVEMSGELCFNKFSLALALIAGGYEAEARRIASELEEKRRVAPVAAYFLAVIYANLGEPEAAFLWLDKAIDERGYWTQWMRVEPRLDELRKDARFAARLEKIKPLGDPKTTADFLLSPITHEFPTPRGFSVSKAFTAAASLVLIFVAALAGYKLMTFKKIVIYSKDAPVAENKSETDANRRPEKPRSQDAVADELYLSGKKLLETRINHDILKAIEFFNEAVKRDPNFAAAFAGLADAHILLAHLQKEPQVSYRKAEDYALKALALDPDLAEARISLGMAKFINTGDFAAAEKHFQRAIEIDPTQATAHHWYAQVLHQVGRIDDAIREREIAARLDPRSAIIQSALGRLYMLSGRYDEALACFDRAIANDDKFVPAYTWKSLIQQYRGEYEASLDTYRRVRIYSGEAETEPFWVLMQAQASAVRGERETALAFLKLAIPKVSRHKDRNELIKEVALVYNLLGDTENTLSWLRKVKIQNPGPGKLMSRDPRFDNLRNNPQFTALMESWQAQK